MDKICHQCKGTGKFPGLGCQSCGGRGTQLCPSCHGTANPFFRCNVCKDRQVITCFTCQGTGSQLTTCPICHGSGRIKQ